MSSVPTNPEGEPRPADPVGPEFTSEPAPTPDSEPAAITQPGDPYAAAPSQPGPAGPAQPGDPYAAAPGYDPAFAAQPEPVERVGRGLLFAVGGVLIGVVLSVIVWQLGFVASITSFVMAALAVYLYSKGAGTAPRKGIVGLMIIVLAGIFVTLVAFIITDLWRYVLSEVPDAQPADTMSFIAANLFNGELWAAYTKDFLLFVLFGVIGVIGTLVGLAKSAKTPAAETPEPGTPAA